MILIGHCMLSILDMAPSNLMPVLCLLVLETFFFYSFKVSKHIYHCHNSRLIVFFKFKIRTTSSVKGCY